MTTGDKAENTGEKIKGAVKKNVGKAVGNERLEAQGRAEQAKGGLKQAGEDVKDAFRS
ncbi:CsbD family protein [Kitasatospora cineracea]|uniref:CsbD-like protein n=1 Tax=Kitasatospora cineracea TaxID=88074 RepID=A0A8G1ULE6_9ACTN|nr:CsbD family protein [Kitasatospora cineracea]ROR46003.1 CsbD-like protein [Kitasatospora cineracea]